MTKGKTKLGEASHFAKWSKDHDFLTMGVEKYDIKSAVGELGLEESAITALCWPVLVSNKPLNKAIAFCKDPTHADHKGGIHAKAHRRPKGFNLAEIRKKFATPAKSIKKTKGGRRKK